MNSSPTSADQPLELPAAFVLRQNYPNPFNPITTIEYSLPSLSTVLLEVFSVMGQHIATLVNSEQHAGTHRVQWNGSNDVQLPMSSGIYIYRLQTLNNVGKILSQQRTMFLVR
jgi:flagellar hook assembly protein FlgD